VLSVEILHAHAGDFANAGGGTRGEEDDLAPADMGAPVPVPGVAGGGDQSVGEVADTARD
jgi:hypothetical protein